MVRRCPAPGECEGCTIAWHLKDAVYLNARGVSLAILTTGRWDEVASYVGFMGYTQLWYSVRDVDAPVGGSMGYTSPASCATATACSSPTPRRGVATGGSTGSLGLLDMTPYGRGEAWEDKPEGRSPCWFWRADADGNATWGPTSRPASL